MQQELHEVAAPVALYEGPRVTLFKGWRLVALVAACVGVGVALHAGVASWQRSRIEHLEVAIAVVPPSPAPASTAERVEWPMTLPGPAGAMVTLAGVAIVHVWLQGCQDCMPAFEAIKRLGPWRLPGATVFNVAYGSADPEWARRYRVDDNLVFDDGSHVVRPLGIGTFTTFVIDERGAARRVGSPAEDGYQRRLHQAARESLHSAPVEVADPARIAETLAYLRGRSGELRECVDWRDGKTASFRLSIGVAPDGALVDVRTVPTPPPARSQPGDRASSAGAAACVEYELRAWNIGSTAAERAEVLVQISMGNDDREQ